jgi:hypothetical protein
MQLRDFAIRKTVRKKRSGIKRIYGKPKASSLSLVLIRAIRGLLLFNAFGENTYSRKLSHCDCPRIGTARFHKCLTGKKGQI